ncbi:hypothetical protein [Amycolatopsis jejuensis]|uniref:hypothetical protein n=1 Tax=Amycolatopsis jejuensis TaxID=330084 RepID=UPI0006899E84|nr:hypothetical protein [Amycolatopsis jejuensis]
MGIIKRLRTVREWTDKVVDFEIEHGKKKAAEQKPEPKRRNDNDGRTGKLQGLGERIGITGIVAVTMAAAVLGLAGCKPEPGTPHPAPSPSVQCEEDEPCWDCHTMGNRQCGPDDPAVKR